MVATLSSQKQVLANLSGQTGVISWIKGIFQSTHEQLRGRKLNTISVQEVGRHNKTDDCWIVLYDKVYDITAFLDQHPGGVDLLMEYAGQDVTFAFENIGHTLKDLERIKDELIGQLPENECIFTNTCMNKAKII